MSARWVVGAVIGATAVASAVMLGAPRATVVETPTTVAVPVCTDWIADHHGICKGEPISDTITLVPCAAEDSDNCYWNAATMGNGRGTSFVTINGQTYYSHP